MQGIIRQFIKDHSEKRKFRIAAFALSMAVIFSVCGSLIMPAISASEESEIGYTEAAAEFNDDFTGYVTAVTIPGDLKNNPASGDVYNDVAFTLSWNIPETAIANGVLKDPDKRTFRYDFDPSFIAAVENPSALTTFKNIPIQYGEAERSGVFSILQDESTKGYYIEVEFGEEFINSHLTALNTDGIHGELTFDASIDRGKDELKNKDVTFSTLKGDVTIPIPFETRTATLTKTAGAFDKNTNTVSWTVEIHNGGNDLSSYELTDSLFADPSSVSNVDISPACGTYDDANGKITFTNETENTNNITITYSTDVSSEQMFDGGHIENKATLKPSDGSEGAISDSADLWLNSHVSFGKEGKYDYESAGGSAEGKANWTLTVDPEDNYDLRGLVITDKMFPDDIADMNISGLDASYFEYDSENKTLTVKDDANPVNVVGGKIVITYSSTVVEGTDYSNAPASVQNNATVKPNKDSSLHKDQSPTINKQYAPANSLGKTASISGDSISYTITVEAYEKADGFKNQTITDPMLKAAKSLSIQNTTDWGGLKYTVDGGTLTFDDSDANSVKRIRITYHVDVDELLEDHSMFTEAEWAAICTQNSDGSYTFRNNVGWDGETGTTDTDYVPPKDVMEKEVVETMKGEDGTTLVKWMVYYDGVEDGLGGLVVTDQLGADDNNVLHYLTDEQLDKSNFTVACSSWDSVKNEDENSAYKLTDFTVTSLEKDSSGNTTKLQITFPSGDTKVKSGYGAEQPISNFDKFAIFYWTTVDNSKQETGTTVIINNSAGKGVEPNDITTEYPIKDSSSVPYRKFDATEFVKSGNATLDNISGGDTKHTLTDMQLVQEKIGANTTDYYVFDWGIVINEDGSETGAYSIEITDTLPEGFELMTSDGYKPVTYYYDSGSGEFRYPYSLPVYDADYTGYKSNAYVQSAGETTGENGLEQQKVIFGLSNYKMEGKPLIFTYKVRIEKNKFEQLLSKSSNTYTVTNTIGDGTHNDVTQTQTVEKGELTKTANTDKSNAVEYSIDVNPSGMDYDPNGLWIDLYDQLQVEGIKNASDIEASLTSIKVEELDENLNVVRTLSEGLTTSASGSTGMGFSYSFTDAEQLDAEAAASKPTWTPSNESIKLSVAEGDIITANVQKPDGYTDAVKGCFGYTDANGDWKSSEWSGTGEKTFTVPEGVTEVYFQTWYGMAEVELTKTSVSDSGTPIEGVTYTGDSTAYDSATGIYTMSGIPKFTLPVNPGDKVLVDFVTASGSGGQWWTLADYSISYQAEWFGSLTSQIITIPAGMNNLSLEISSFSETQVRFIKIYTTTESLGKYSTTGNTGPELSAPKNPYSARLKITVPDDKRLRITYLYTLKHKGKDDTEKGETITVTNSVQSNISGSPQTAQNTSDIVIGKTSSAWSAMKTPISVVKVDAGSTAIRLSAGFEVYRYNPEYTDADGDHWQPATEFSLDEGTGVNEVKTWGETADAAAKFNTLTDNENAYLLKVDKDVTSSADDAAHTYYMYKLVEVDPPANYSRVGDGDYYFAYNKLPSGKYMPADEEIQGRCKLLGSSGTQLNISNYRDITISVQKDWAGADWSGFDNVECKLVRSHTQISGGGLPASYEEVQLVKTSDGYRMAKSGDADTDKLGTFSITNGEPLKITGLPNGDSGNLTWYYYVEEISYTVKGGESTPITGSDYVVSYTGNGAATDGAEITVTNSSSLIIEKKWHDTKGSEVTAPVDKITLELYRSTVNDVKIPEGAEMIGTITVSGEDGWVWNSKNAAEDIKSQIIKDDGAGNTYYYYVKETDCPKGYTSLANHSNAMGTITLVNTAETENSGAVLPETGGTGTAPYLAAGALITAGAIAYYIINKRHCGKCRAK